jgi:hypothetical protein
MKETQRSTTGAVQGICSFYCRWKNRVVQSCRREGGPGACPLRNECPADTMVERLPAAPRLLSS